MPLITVATNVNSILADFRFKRRIVLWTADIVFKQKIVQEVARDMFDVFTRRVPSATH